MAASSSSSSSSSNTPHTAAIDTSFLKSVTLLPTLDGGRPMRDIHADTLIIHTATQQPAPQQPEQEHPQPAAKHRAALSLFTATNRKGGRTGRRRSANDADTYRVRIMRVLEVLPAPAPPRPPPTPSTPPPMSHLHRRVRSATEPGPRQKLTFSTVTIHEHERKLGGSLGVPSKGVDLGIGWKQVCCATVDVDEFQKAAATAAGRRGSSTDKHDNGSSDKDDDDADASDTDSMHERWRFDRDGALTPAERADIMQAGAGCTAEEVERAVEEHRVLQEARLQTARSRTGAQVIAGLDPDDVERQEVEESAQEEAVHADVARTKAQGSPQDSPSPPLVAHANPMMMRQRLTRSHSARAILARPKAGSAAAVAAAAALSSAKSGAASGSTASASASASASARAAGARRAKQLRRYSLTGGVAGRLGAGAGGGVGAGAMGAGGAQGGAGRGGRRASMSRGNRGRGRGRRRSSVGRVKARSQSLSGGQ